jgi:alpha-glucosidase
MAEIESAAWWQRGVIYQIYPRSFQDSNGDGIGDLRGIIQRLDHLTWLGVDAIWLSPVYPSPMADFGYDIADFKDIDAVFGTLADFDLLIAEARRRHLKIIMDFVPNHTSDQHPWFREARSSRDNAKRDWYIWHDPAPGGGPPNNWLSEFGGSAWEYDEPSGQYYYHAFLKQQPDLNWRNPALRHEMHNVLRFWLDRGVDGFRIDVVHQLIEDAAFRDNPPNPEFAPGMPPSHALRRVHTIDHPELQDVIADLRRVVDEYPEKVLIGEIHLPIERLVAYYGVELGGIHLPFNFNLLRARWSADILRELIATYEAALPEGAWPNWVVGNHDTSRIATRLGQTGACLAMVLLLTLRGTPTMYYGEELCMADVAIPPDRIQDPFEKNVPGIGVGRDPARTPMRWTSGKNGGFSDARPWLPMGDNLESINVASQARNPRSTLSMCRRLLALRRSQSALSVGSYVGLDGDPECLAFMRQYRSEQLFVLLNFSTGPRTVTLPDGTPDGELLFSSDVDRKSGASDGRIRLGAAEGVVLRVA